MCIVPFAALYATSSILVNRLIAVSYTHLDDLGINIIKDGYSKDRITLVTLDKMERINVEPVSYTHLDGYKRQEQFRSMPFDVTKRKKWADYVAECHAKGKEIDYDNYD